MPQVDVFYVAMNGTSFLSRTILQRVVFFFQLLLRIYDALLKKPHISFLLYAFPSAGTICHIFGIRATRHTSLALPRKFGATNSEVLREVIICRQPT